jgi:hypothetical protein
MMIGAEASLVVVVDDSSSSSSRVDSEDDDDSGHTSAGVYSLLVYNHKLTVALSRSHKCKLDMEQHCKWIVQVYGPKLWNRWFSPPEAKACCTRMRPKLHLPALVY